jgi:hypothetical protein
MQYKAHRNQMGHLVVQNVPIFVTCKRGDSSFDKGWLEQAVMAARQAELEGYLPPLHIRHHDDGPQPEPAGFFRIRGCGPITFKGDMRTAIFADLTITRPHVEEDVLKARLPYRSVEIFDVDVPAINSLALLDHEPPYLELPMLMIASIDGESNSTSLANVASATFSNPYQRTTAESTEPMVACFRRGHSAQLFFQDTESMSITTQKPTAKAAKPAKGKKFADDGEDKKSDSPSEGEDKKDGENMEGDESALDVAAVCKAISDGSISVADMESIKAAIMAQEVATEPEEEAEAPVATVPSPGDAMKGKSTNGESFAAMQGKIDALEAKLQEREASEGRKDDVALAMKRLEGRPMGADVEAKLEAFHRGHGASAFKDYVDSLCTNFAARSGGDDTAAANFKGASDGASKVALAYVEQGTDAVAQATKFSREWELARKSGTRMSESRYVEINMAKAGFSAKA